VCSDVAEEDRTGLTPTGLERQLQGRGSCEFDLYLPVTQCAPEHQEDGGGSHQYDGNPEEKAGNFPGVKGGWHFSAPPNCGAVHVWKLLQTGAKAIVQIK
jgi:hypothetical protein